MNTYNLLTAYQGAKVIEEKELEVASRYKVLKTSERKILEEMCDLFKIETDNVDVFDGYYIGYSIPQISKEFDLLRIGFDKIINIEIKSYLEPDIRDEKIIKQLKKNNYYLNFLEKDVRLYAYIENDGFFKYVKSTEKIEKIEAAEVVNDILGQVVDYNFKIEQQFKPSKYLVSPFNQVEKFLMNEYFLTSSQEEIKKVFIKGYEDKQLDCLCLSAHAGTGKTLLSYDIVHECIKKGISTLIIHCGKLNAGHEELKRKKGWNIYSISAITNEDRMKLIAKEKRVILVDEVQRINRKQLEWIISFAKEHKAVLLFSYDPRQVLKKGEGINLFPYMLENHSEVKTISKTLTTKIRTNKAMASFVRNMFERGSSRDNLNYENITIEYMDNLEDVRRYIGYLEKNRGWKAITFTASMYNIEPVDRLSVITDVNAHDIIGQEFEKVVFVLDDIIKYDDTSNKLLAKRCYYSVSGMLYQIVTRVVNELKIIVLDNPKLYKDLLDIKKMGDRD